MAVSPDGKLFIVACGTNYEGNMDLYYSVKQDGEWSFLKRLNVSTEGDERSVYIASDNKTIYFSSNGHGGFGGLDILKTTWFEGNATSRMHEVWKCMLQLKVYGLRIGCCMTKTLHN